MKVGLSRYQSIHYFYTKCVPSWKIELESIFDRLIFFFFSRTKNISNNQYSILNLINYDSIELDAFLQLPLEFRFVPIRRVSSLLHVHYFE